MPMLEVLIHIVRLPYEFAKRQNEESIVGQSDWDRKSFRFWKWFAWIGTGLIIVIPLTLSIIWLVISRQK